MAKKSTGPNIPGFATAFRGNKKILSHKIKGCDGRILQRIRGDNAERPVGRAFCQNCSHLLGKKFWHNLLEQMNDSFQQPPEGYVRLGITRDRDPVSKQDSWYRYFIRQRETKLHLPTTAAEAKELQDFLGRASPMKLQEMLEAALREAPELADPLKKLFASQVAREVNHVLESINDVGTAASEQPDSPPSYVGYGERYVQRVADEQIALLRGITKRQAMPPPPYGDEVAAPPGFESPGASALMKTPGGWILRWKDIRLTLPETYALNDAEFFKAEVDNLTPNATHAEFKHTVECVWRALREEGHPSFFLCQHQPTVQRPYDYFLEEDPVPEGNEDTDF